MNAASRPPASSLKASKSIMSEHVETLPRVKRFDGATILGLASAVGLVVIAIFFGGAASAFFDLPSVLIVVGGTLAVTTICFSCQN